MHSIKNENRIFPNSQSALKSQFAKLLCPEKSMTADTRRRSNDLRSGEQVSVSELAGQFKRAASARFTSTNPTPSGLGKESELKWPQKGDFNGQMSFANGS